MLTKKDEDGAADGVAIPMTTVAGLACQQAHWWSLWGEFAEEEDQYSTVWPVEAD